MALSAAAPLTLPFESDDVTSPFEWMGIPSDVSTELELAERLADAISDASLDGLLDGAVPFLAGGAVFGGGWIRGAG